MSIGAIREYTLPLPTYYLVGFRGPGVGGCRVELNWLEVVLNGG